MFFKDKPVFLKSLEPNFPEIEILSFGIHDFNYLRGIKNFRQHPHHTFHFIIQGSGYLTLDGITHHLKSNTFFMTPANTTLKYFPDHLDPWTYAWFDIKDTPNVMTFFEGLKLDITKPFYKTKLSHKILPLFEQMFTDEAQSHTQLPVYASFYQITSTLQQELHTLKSLDLVDKALIYIEKNYTNPALRITDIVDELSISQTYLNESFKKRTGQTMIAYLIDYRLNKASDLLKSPNLSIQAAASMVGYDDMIHFSKSFKKKFGITASQYRIQTT